MKIETTRGKGRGNRSLLCPSCQGSIIAMMFSLNKTTSTIPNRKYCRTCDKVWKISYSVEA